MDTWQATRAPDPDPIPTRPDPRAPARDHAREIVHGEGLLFPDLEAPPAAVVRKPTKKVSTPKAKPAPTPVLPPTEKAQDRYGDAYERAHRDQGFPITSLSVAERRLLGRIAQTHARYRDDTPIVGDELVRWFYERGRAFRREVPDPLRHRGGASPYGFQAWLDAGADGEPRWLPPGQTAPEEGDRADWPEEARRPIPLPELPPERVASARAIVEKFLPPARCAS